MFGLSSAHHVLMFLVFRRVYAGFPAEREAAVWYPVANLVVDLILFRALRMCLTGKVMLAMDRLTA